MRHLASWPHATSAPAHRAHWLILRAHRGCGSGHATKLGWQVLMPARPGGEEPTTCLWHQPETL